MRVFLEQGEAVTGSFRSGSKKIIIKNKKQRGAKASDSTVACGKIFT